MLPLEALRAWMLLFIDHVSEKKLITPAMDTVAGGSMRFIEGARPLIHTAFVAAVMRAIARGALRSNTDPNDFVRALIGVLHTTAIPGWESSARRLTDILITGSRSTPMHPSTHFAGGENSEAPEHTGACAFYNRIAISRSLAGNRYGAPIWQILSGVTFQFPTPAKGNLP